MQKVLTGEEELLARYGGEEFALLLPRTDPARAMTSARRVCDAVASLQIAHAFARAADRLTVSVGAVSVQPAAGIKPSQFVGAADRALYRAKNEGRNRIVKAELEPAAD
jgi:diguanylate cyclase (GGDEF)-like protein